MTETRRIEPRTLKGFRDYLPESMIPREQLMEVARRVYRSYGFSPIDTPALEYEEVLTGKGGGETDKQLFRFTDQGGRQVAMRFDLTVPFARFAAQYVAQLGTPFKRYHIGTVWRGEKPARGRFREFVQCDFDTIGTESVVSDLETALVIHDLLEAAGFEDFTIQFNDRKILTGLLERLDLSAKAADVLRALDKLAKIGPEKVADEMKASANVTDSQAKEVLAFAETHGEDEDVLEKLRARVGETEAGREGLERVSEIVTSLRALGVPGSRARLDLSIARGLDYYTGMVFETILGKLPEIGSVCSGGRYDNLAEVYTKERLPGIGASLGVDRLLAAMEELGMVEKRASPAPVFVPLFDPSHLVDYLKLTQRLRAGGIGVELYPEHRKLAAQLRYADRRGFRVAVICGRDEWSAGTCQVKDLASGESRAVALGEVVAAVRGIVGT